MASELDAAIVKRTQTTLGKFVKRPALTEKLLRKPPFRFLHDIVHAIIREHGLLDGLYTADELNSDNIKDRDSKMAFLQKLNDVVKLTTGRELKVRPSKVVAGLEPERTNELLQALGYALEQKLSSVDAVRQCLADSSTAPSNGPPAQEPPSTNGHVAAANVPEGRKEKSKEKAKEKDPPPGADKKRDRAPKTKEKETAKNGPVVQRVDLRADKSKSKQNGSKAPPGTESKRKSDKSGKGKEKEKPLKRISSIAEELQPTEAVVNGSEAVANEKPTDGRKRRDSMKEVGDASETHVGKASNEEPILTVDEEQERRNKQPGSNGSSRRSSLKKQNSLTASENNALSEMNQFNGLERSPGPSRQDSGATGEQAAAGGQEGGETMEPGTSITVTVAAEPKVVGKPPMHRQPSVIIDTVMRPRTSLRPPSVRPPSARPGAPRRKEKNVEVILQPNEMQKLGDINVKMEVFNNEMLDDDGENLIVIEDPTTAADVYGGVVVGTMVTGEAEDGASSLLHHETEEQQGHLVQQILETQKEFSSHTGTDGEMLRKADMEWTAGQRQSSAKQMESLRDSIQKLTRSVNPLGKLMDFIQEDIDAMERELATWQQTYSQSIVELNKERSATENAIEPLKQQVSQIELNIKEYREMIDATRANILQNEQKIERLYMTEI